MGNAALVPPAMEGWRAKLKPHVSSVAKIGLMDNDKLLGQSKEYEFEEALSSHGCCWTVEHIA